VQKDRKNKRNKKISRKSMGKLYDWQVEANEVVETHLVGVRLDSSLLYNSVFFTWIESIACGLPII
jgi:hypothetical protein